MTDTKKTTLLPEIVVIRLLLILLLVLYHAFAPFYGTWSAIPSYPESGAYYLIGAFAYLFFLEMFTFISGYLFGYAKKRKGDGYVSMNNCIWKKCKRLLLPSVVFSALYIAAFTPERFCRPDVVLSILDGVGHMWFLPMLFGCFVLTYIFSRLKIDWRFELALAFLLCFSPRVTDLHIGLSLYYFLFFLVGQLVAEEKFGFLKRESAAGYLLLAAGYAVSFFLLLHLSQDTVVMQLLTRLAKVVCAFSATLFVYKSARKTNLQNTRIWPTLVTLSGYCFGIYLFQQFILVAAYYHTGLPMLVSWKIFPWMMYAVTLLASALISYLFLKTKVGRFLIG